MSNPFPLRPGLTVAMAPQLAGPVARYALMALADRTVVYENLAFDKRMKAVHRFDIADTHGRVSLTIPIAKPVSATRARWCDIVPSDHGHWWTLHMTALESAYGRTPFFQFYADDLLAPVTGAFPPAVERRGEQVTITDIARHVERRACSILTLPEPVYETAAMPPRGLRPVAPETGARPYWQIRQDKHGFLGGLSVLDLIFNLGPDAAPYLLERARELLEPVESED